MNRSWFCPFSNQPVSDMDATNLGFGLAVTKVSAEASSYLEGVNRIKFI